MELKKFEAPTLAQALEVVKRELGPEAVILSTKNNRSSFGLLNRSSVEVTAAVSADALERKIRAEARLSPTQREALTRKPAAQAARSYEVLSGASLQKKLANTPAEALVSQNSAFQAKFSPAAGRPITQRRYIDIHDDESPAEIESMRPVDQNRIRPQSVFVAANPRPTQGLPTTGVLTKLMEELLEQGVDAEIVRKCGDELKALMIREHMTQESNLRLQMARIVMSHVRVAKPLGERLRLPNTPRVITFIGPTGVGKTTTIAKIAAELVLHQKRPVVLVTTDTFKIAAVEQLQTYANILKIPLEVCPTAEALENLSNTISPETVALVDTAGYGPRDDQKLTELQEMLSVIRTEVHLCVGAMTRDRDMTAIIQRFRKLHPDYLVVTKIDETAAFGALLNVAVQSHLPLSYFTMGQRVPEDMEVATRERVADLLLNVGA
jgi:flagellar biosynthesis protein FlhF